MGKRCIGVSGVRIAFVAWTLVTLASGRAGAQGASDVGEWSGVYDNLAVDQYGVTCYFTGEIVHAALLPPAVDTTVNPARSVAEARVILQAATDTGCQNVPTQPGCQGGP